MIDESELKSSVKHNPLKIYKKLIDRQKQKIEEIRKGLEAHPKLEVKGDKID